MEARQTSRWYKCDLQVATPAWNFAIPSGVNYNFEKQDDRAAFADSYMQHLQARGIDVIALADHHTAEWLPDMRAAGERVGVTVFPGVEVTTGSGSDGVHLVLIGDLEMTEHDIDTLLVSTCGFDGRDNPRFNPARAKEPAPSPKSIADILTELPDGWLAFAPHVLGDNGLASPRTAKGTIRWKALHHDRLAAIDVGHPDDDPKDGGSGGFNQKFRSRSLIDFPCLGRMAFISTSDAYDLDTLGRRFTWIRMNKPSLEGLRQAFLDHEARIIRCGDERLGRTEDPNKVDHAWIEKLSLGGELGNSTTPLNVSFDPRLTVIIGSRGTGKSTLVAGLRQLYSSEGELPGSLREEAKDFTRRIFSSAALMSTHHLPISGERQEAQWHLPTGSLTQRGTTTTPTAFPVRLFAQKELYERIKSDPQDPYSASRNLIALIDAAISAEGNGSTEEFEAERIAAENKYEHVVRMRQELQTVLARRSELTARASELRTQIAALDNADLRQRRDRNGKLMKERAEIEAQATRLEGTVHDLRAHVSELLTASQASVTTEHVESDTAQAHSHELQRIRIELQGDIIAAIARAEAALKTADHSRQGGAWADKVRLAVIDDAECQAQLAALGVAPEQYLKLREDLASVEDSLAHIDRQQQELVRLQAEEEAAWDSLVALRDARARRRANLTKRVELRSSTLRFQLSLAADWVGWVAASRELLNLRADGFIEEVRTVGRWLWSGTFTELTHRLGLWRSALIDADADRRRLLEQSLSGVRKSWWERLWRFDSVLRLRLAMLMADDVITMRFLKNGGNPDREQDWQDVSQGSPGQRGAAMLSFVLHHGNEPLILDQPEDDLDTSLISDLIVTELRKSRWNRQIIVVTHNANIPVLGDAEKIIVMEARDGALAVKRTGEMTHAGPIEITEVRKDIQDVMEGGVAAFIMREKRYDNELSEFRRDLDTVSKRAT